MRKIIIIFISSSLLLSIFIIWNIIVPREEIIYDNIKWDFSEEKLSYIQVGDTINFDEELTNLKQKYSFNKEIYYDIYEYFFPVGLSTNNRNIKISKPGVYRIIVDLQKDFYSIYANINTIRACLGTFIALPNETEIKTFFSLDELKASLDDYQYFQLGSNIVTDENSSYDPIERLFHKTIINPNNYTISGLKSVLFESINFSIIDNLILDNVNIKQEYNPYDENNRNAALCNISVYSYLNNVSIEGNIEGGQSVASLSTIIFESFISNCSFIGNIKSDSKYDTTYVGGLVVGKFPFSPYFSSVTIKNSYVIGNLEGDYVGALFCNIGEQTSSHDYTKLTLIKNSYFVGKITQLHESKYYPFIAVGEIINNYTTPYNNCYYAIVGQIPNKPNQVSIEYLKSGEKIEGFDSFIFEYGKYPRLR